MYVSLPPGCYASAVMCEEHSIVPFFLNSNLLCLVAYFFRCYCQRYLVRFLFQVFVCLFVFISGKRNTNLFTFPPINVYDGRHFTIRFIRQV